MSIPFNVHPTEMLQTRKKLQHGSHLFSKVASMVVEMVPLKGGIGSIFHPPGSARTISGIFPANWGMDYATYLPPFRGTRNNH